MKVDIRRKDLERGKVDSKNREREEGFVGNGGCATFASMNCGSGSFSNKYLEMLRKVCYAEIS